MTEKAAVLKILNEWIKDFEQSSKSSAFGAIEADAKAFSEKEIKKLKYIKNAVLRSTVSVESEPFLLLREHAKRCAAAPIKSIKAEGEKVLAWCNSKGV